MKNKYAILRTKKHSDNTRITKAADHNLRTGFITRNVNREKTSLNFVLKNDFGASSGKEFTAKLEEYYKSKEIEKRKNNVLLMEFVLTASPEFFTNLDEAEKKNWLEKQAEFLKSEFGDAVKLAIAHMDEKSPHIHCFLSTEHTTTKKYKNRYGTCEKTTTTLNAKRFDRDYLIGLQTRFAEFNKPFGLFRGAFHSKAKNKTLKSFWRALDQSSDDKALYNKIKSKIASVKVPISQRFSNEAIAQAVIDNIKPELTLIAQTTTQLRKLMQFNFADLQNRLKAERDNLEKERKQFEEKRKSFDANYLKRIELDKKLKEKEQEIAELKQLLLNQTLEVKSKNNIEAISRKQVKL